MNTRGGAGAPVILRTPCVETETGPLKGLRGMQKGMFSFAIWELEALVWFLISE